MWRDWKFVGTLLAMLGLPLIAMALLPLADTSEPRYAEIARLMAETGDWITPWFAPGTPFWGKPPMSFWMQAVSFRLLGVNEFAARFPSWLVTVCTLWLIHQCALHLFDRITARRAVLIYGSCTLAVIACGAVLTDPYLALGSTLCMTGWLMASRHPTLFWRYSFFLGLSVGLLAKGPLILVLVGGVLVPWFIFFPSARATVKALPWVGGILLTLVLSVPWYVAAEWKTPGFIDYFIVGENFRRFINPGWAGDLYGTAHKAHFGTIWYYWLQATFPWGLVAIALLLKAIASGRQRTRLVHAVLAPELAYLLGWALFTPVFFTTSANILWTYLLPSLAGLCIVIAYALPCTQFCSRSWPLGRYTTLALMAPVILAILSIAATVKPEWIKTEKGLVHYASQAAGSQAALFYLDELPFSARFYSRDEAKQIDPQQLSKLIDRGESVWVAVPKTQAKQQKFYKKAEQVYENRRFVLLHLSGNESHSTASPAAESALFSMSSQ